ncbi:BQ2448_2756 [Microbotryum intermedium]|uniref:BQ2448_2756 protein n=1 Tax=Microbotryum intermedium TaxID=269621 RepID=A0A238FJ14_9BASI|nr:BQ2448_2756 [Microbotryum intermedium]
MSLPMDERRADEDTKHVKRAYLLDTTHVTLVGYASYDLNFGVCSNSSSIITSEQMTQRECVETVVRVFGSHAAPVPITKSVIANRPPFAGRPDDVKGSSGSVRHFRVKSEILFPTLLLTKNFTDLSLSLLNSSESRKVRLSHSSHKCDDRAEATQIGHQRPTGSKGKPKTLKPVGPARIENPIRPQHDLAGVTHSDPDFKNEEAVPRQAISDKLRQAWDTSSYVVLAGAGLSLAAIVALIVNFFVKGVAKGPREGYVMLGQGQAGLRSRKDPDDTSQKFAFEPKLLVAADSTLRVSPQLEWLHTAHHR